ncbi:sorbitol dehydrogenase-like protein [Euroglyphus maynei]|uniref:Sorbitol dehydrogenase n=1 Tax=Euroglyphus maynei TaxID=6958 RepID=A0A1Y3B9B3_EURMA|nr:sorbitol dehydrogenase-like protein [Euroglyphus maynei]
MATPLSMDLFSEENLAVVLYGQNDLRLERWPLPDKLENDGICGTDLHLWRQAQVADFRLQRPFCLGHEPSAIVMKCGSNVHHLKPGDRVAVEPAIPCLKCDRCRSGRYNLCPTSNKQSHGLPNSDGSLRRYYTHRADFCFKLPDSISLEEGALIEALAVVIHACRRVKIQPGDSVLVCGAGPVGVMAMLVAKAFGSNRVCVTDIKQTRLDLAKKMGADHCYWIDLSQKDLNAEDRAAHIVEMMGRPPDITLECTGVASSQSLAIHATEHGGRIAIVGLGQPSNGIPLSTMTMKEIDLIGVCRIKDDYPLAIELLESGKINVKPLITQRFAIEQALEAFRLLASPPDNDQSVVKVLIQYNNDDD